MDIYFSSVGRNGVLLLNVPPDRRGRFAEVDRQHLLGFGVLRDSVFSHNPLSRSNILSPGGRGKLHSIADGRFTTSYTLAKSNGEAYISFISPTPLSVNVLMVQEDIRHGQRIESFRLEAENRDGNFVTVATGTTAGYKRLICFPRTESRIFRLVITSSRLDPVISEVGLYSYK